MTTTEITRPGRAAVDAAGPALLFAAMIAAAVFFQEGLAALLAAWATPEYSHGPLIPILSGFLMLRQLKAVPAEPGPVADRWPGVAVAVAALLMGLLGKLSGIADFVAYGLILWIAGMVLVSFGWRRGRQFWPPVLHLVFMLPLPGLFYYKLSTTLQFISSEIGVLLVQAAGVPASLDGNVIDLGDYKLLVAEACSGLRYLFPILSFSYIFAVLYRGPMWHKAVLLLSAAPITVLMNSFRIGLVGVMVDRFGIQSAEGFSHLMEGWVIFIACVGILFGIARLLLAMRPGRIGLVDALDLDTSALGPQAARLGLVRPSAALIAVAALFAVAAGAWLAAPERLRPEVVREPLTLFPARFGDWRGAPPQMLTPDIAAALGADDYRSVVYALPGSRAGVELFIAWYEDQSSGGIHSPEICLPGSGWEIASIARVDIADEMGLSEPLPLNRAVIQKGLDRIMVYYWFEQYGGRTAWDVAAKIKLLRDGARYGRTDGALMRLTTPIQPDETAAAAEARLRALLAPALEVLPRFVPRA